MTYRRKFTDGRDLRAAESSGEVGRTVMVEVSTEVLATLLGQRFIDMDNTKVVSMEQVVLYYDDHVGRCMADPVFVQQEPAKREHFCGTCAQCRL